MGAHWRKGRHGVKEENVGRDETQPEEMLR